MAIQEASGFFNAMNVNGAFDRLYDASDFAAYFATFIGNGVFANPADELKIIAKSGLTVKVKKGKAFVEGYWYNLKEDTEITISPNTGGYTENVAICCTLNKSQRKIGITVRKSSDFSGMNPVNDGSIHELVLCTISLASGAGTITNSMIVDRRPDSFYCGFVSGTVDKIDVGDLFIKYDEAFNEWFNKIKGQLSTDAAGKLSVEIENVNKSLESFKTEVNKQPKIRSGTSKPNNLIGKDGDVYFQII